MSEQTDTAAVPEAVPALDAVPASAPALEAGHTPVPAPEATEASAEVAQAPKAPEAPEAAPAAVTEAGFPPAPPKDRRRLFAALRWTAAVAVFAAVGTGVAYGITQPERTDIPGLSTEDDGRWTFPELSQPALPAGAPVPQGPDNKDGTHYAKLNGLLLPAPVGARADDTVKADKDGVVSVDGFLEEYTSEAREKLKQSLEWDGLRQITGRGWTTADGTRTHVYLLRFHSSGFVDAFKGCDSNAQLNGVSALDLDDVWSKAKNTQMNSTTLDFPGAANFDGTELSVYQEVKPFLGEEQTKVGCLRTGDVLGMVIQTRKGEVAPVTFHQSVILQSQLLS
ncbi:hypothetical protein OG818_01400 [Streptomyces virginiae]|uniref:hypothetical protein n=1 Tax=Streptomyces virginiae TaxID=1961 RepID=UPI00225A76CD|nr:hypothetical protein [Streptomyces virginiae]MCX4714479.1 hypothetical protein [Streptomyces virginiae]